MHNGNILQGLMSQNESLKISLKILFLYSSATVSRRKYKIDSNIERVLVLDNY